MKKSIPILILLLISIPMTPLENPETIVVSQDISSVIVEAKPKYNKKRQDRRTSPKRMNRRAKRIQRKYGIGLLIMKEVTHA